VVTGLGEQWELPGIFFKPYPCNHFTHAGIDAALELRSRGVSPDDVDEIELGVAAPVLRTIAEPPGAKARPESGYHAAFSGPYTVAAALVGGGGLGVGHDDFTDEAAADDRRLDVAARVRCVSDERCDSIFPVQLPAVLRARTADGTRHEVRVDVNRGGPDNPLSADEHATKFRMNALQRIEEPQAARLADLVLALPDGARLGDVMDLVHGEDAR
jgi:2-methylcitrate dehydratase PrpD